jgi:hypothetical protein
MKSETYQTNDLVAAGLLCANGHQCESILCGAIVYFRFPGLTEGDAGQVLDSTEARIVKNFVPHWRALRRELSYLLTRGSQRK